MRGIVKKCLTCGKEIYAYPSKIDRKKYCSRSCKARDRIAERNSNFKGGITLCPAGYLKFSSGAYAHKFKYVHRHIMEGLLGRKLKDGEVVHHVNGNRIDNRIENLELMTRAKHMIHHRMDINRGRGIC